MRQALEPRLLSVGEAANYLGLSARGVWTLIDTGRLPVVRLGRRVRLDRGQLDLLIKEQTTVKAAGSHAP